MNSIWIIWAVNLLFQNFAFTFVSRARSSGSLRRHVVAAVMSNFAYIFQLSIMLGPMMAYMTGKHGVLAQVGVGLYYTAFTVTGSVVAHSWALKTEKGKGAVGANDKYVQISREEWAELQQSISELRLRATRAA